MRAGMILMVMMAGLALLCCSTVSPAQTAPAKGLEPWASNTDPTDVAKSHVENVTEAKHDYAVTQGGTMDGYNCSEPVGVWKAWKQIWESNRSVRLENVGDTDVINPWISNGRNNYRTEDEIIASATTPDMGAGEKALAVFYDELLHHWHNAAAGGGESGNPVKLWNVYGYSACGDNSAMVCVFWKALGLDVRTCHVVGHCVTQPGYDGGWHIMDGDMHTWFLLRDNKTLASEQQVARDQDLIRRTRVFGMLERWSTNASESHAARYIYDGEAVGTRDGTKGPTMNMTLRPGESIVWRWGSLTPVKYWGKWAPERQAKENGPGKICNGLWEYRPDLSRDVWKKGAQTVDSVASTKDGLAPEAGKKGVIVWKMQSPYPFVGGRLEAEGVGYKLFHSFDGAKWQSVDPAEGLDWLFPPAAAAPRYSYFLKCELPEGAQLKKLSIINDLQMSPLLLPGIVVGKNSFTYTDASTGARQIRITHEWVERSSSKPPEAPSAVYPPDGGESDGTDVCFKWSLPTDPDGDNVVDYQFMLSPRADMRYPLSPSFAMLNSKMPGGDSGKPQYTLPYPGMLTPGTKYYWHVRARDAKGVWGPWSNTFSFTAQGVAYPVDVALAFDEAKAAGTLQWKANPVGRKPVKYRVYGSDHKGFPVSDAPYNTNLGKSTALTNPFPANFVAETDKTEMVVIGRGLASPNANKAYYRVVAVDDKGKRSWSSDFVEAPRAFVGSTPVLAAKVGQAYQYQLNAIRSIGDLRTRAGDAQDFFDVEKTTYTLRQGPAWLKLDTATGLLSGTPDAPGKVEVVIGVAVDKEVPQINIDSLAWGQYNPGGTEIERLARGTQQFTIEVGK